MQLVPKDHIFSNMNDMEHNLAGKMLLAMPDMGDLRFEQSVIFMCAHSEDGAMGLIVNKPADDLKFDDLLEQLEIDSSQPRDDIRVHFGGPVENGRGFVLHSADYGMNHSTLQVGSHFGMTATLDILEDMAQGAGPKDSLLALGYAGWGPGQLEAEILQNGWLTCDASPDLIFGTENDQKWSACLNTMGINPLLLSAQAGRA